MSGLSVSNPPVFIQSTGAGAQKMLLFSSARNTSSSTIRSRRLQQSQGPVIPFFVRPKSHVCDAHLAAAACESPASSSLADLTHVSASAAAPPVTCDNPSSCAGIGFVVGAAPAASVCGLVVSDQTAFHFVPSGRRLVVARVCFPWHARIVLYCNACWLVWWGWLFGWGRSVGRLVALDISLAPLVGLLVPGSPHYQPVHFPLPSPRCQIPWCRHSRPKVTRAVVFLVSEEVGIGFYFCWYLRVVLVLSRMLAHVSSALR